ncbi:YtxH domain-containing protein [Virgibacillus sediminis]|uniref:YtxH domain-containing protein n=1 Tax=Virgibacillus sediminis TaxID=202260 RepID=A0ABV7AB15_9BACI
MTRGKSIFLGLIIGGSVSAAVTLLSTPSTGREIRSRMKEQGYEARNFLYSLKLDVQRLKDQLADTSKEGIVMIRELTEEMKDSIAEWRNTVEPHQENIQQYLEQIESSLKDLEDKVNNQNVNV